MLFLSHSGADAAAAKELARHLREAGLEVWLDLDHLQPGDAWMAKLEEALQQARAFAVYVGSAGIQRWVDREVRVALERSTTDPEFRIIPILGEGAEGPEALPYFLRQHQAVDFRREISPAELQRLKAAILDQRPEAVSLLPPGTAPFRGLEYFDVEHAHLFFGRDAETQELLEKLRADRFLAVVGASGSGKSSLVRAGLIPVLHRGRFQNGGSWPAPWRIAICRPGDRPLRALASALPNLGPETSPAERIRTVEECARQLERGTEGLEACIDGLVPRGHRTLLLVDQFEELFTLTAAHAERRQFIDALLGIADGGGDRPVHVLITLRADFYSRSWEHPELPERIARNQHAARPLLRAQLKEIIEKPLTLAGAAFEPGLVDRILQDAGEEPGSLPLLQHALLQLWERRQGKVLTHAAYEEIGGVSGALAHHADEVFELLDEEGREIAQKIFLRLTHPGEGTEDTRRRADREEIVALGDEAETTERVLTRLAAAEARLVVTRREGENSVVEVAHEALIRAWPRLREWIEANRAAIRIERRLIEATAEWLRVGRDPDALLRGAYLAEAEEWAQQHWKDLRPQEQEFVERSIAARDQAIREAEERRQHELEMARRLAEEAEARARAEKQAARRNRTLAGILAVAAVAALVAASIAVQARAEAEANFDHAVNAVNESLALVARDPQDVSPQYDPQVELLRHDLLTRAEGFYLDLIQQRPGSRKVRERSAFARFRLGSINLSLERREEAVAEYGRAIEQLETLVREQPENPAYRQVLASAYNWLGETLRRSPDTWPQAKSAYESALAHQQQLLLSHPDSTAYRQDLARTHYNRGILHSHGVSADAAAWKAAEADFHQAIALLEPLAAAGASPRTLQDLGRAYNNLGSLIYNNLGTVIPFDERRLEEAQGWYERAIGLYEELIREAPDNRLYKLELVQLYNNLAEVLRERGEYQLALQRNSGAHDLIEELARLAPRLGIDRADVHNLRARISESQGLPAALLEYRRSLELFQRLEADPLAWSLPEFHQRYEDLLVNLAELASEHPSDAALRRLLSDAVDAYLGVARRIAASGSPADAQKALDHFSRVIPELPDRDRSGVVSAFERVRPQLQERAAGRPGPASGSSS